jgi:hypothetical protein
MRSATKKRTGRDKAYLEWLHTLPCIAGPSSCRGLIEAAHVGVRGLSQKAPDREALPVCSRHHRESICSLHFMGKKFWAFHGLDKNKLIAEYQARFDAEQGGK